MSEDRYQRQSLIDWLSQDRLKSMRVAVAGAGAIGNELIKNLALFGVGSIHIYDFDKIEAHNLTRSVLFRQSDVGRSKAECAAERGRELDPFVDLRSTHGDVWDTLKLEEVAAFDVVISCVDSLETRMRLNRMCRLVGCDFINTGIDSRFASVDVHPFRRSPDCACFECSLPSTAYLAIAARYSCGWLPRRAFVERKIPTTIVTASTSAAMATSIAVRLGSPEPAARHVSIDTIAGSTIKFTAGRRKGCVGCGWLAADVELVLGKTDPARLENLLAAYPSGALVRVSDPLIVSGHCAHCDYEIGGGGIDLRRASRYDDSLTQCPNCHQKTIAIDIRDRFTIEELIRLSSRGLPTKYIVLELESKSFVVEMEQPPQATASNLMEDLR